jgi:hypothetical protein
MARPGGKDGRAGYYNCGETMRNPEKFLKIWQGLKRDHGK